MMRTTTLARRTSLVLTIALALQAAPPALAQAQPAPPAGSTAEKEALGKKIVNGYTSKPYVLAKPGVNQFGTVLERPVKVGQRVKAGDVVLRQDDRQERALLEALELEADSNVRIEAAEADLKIKQLQFERLKELLKTGSANPTEVEEADVKVIYADAQLKIARLEREKNKREAERQRYKVEQMTVKSPVDGFVEQIDVEVGDVTDPQRPVMTIVQNDPLKVEFFIPSQQSQKLKVGQDLQVRYPGEEQWLTAKVAFKAPVVDTASDEQKIGLEMKNVGNRDAGLRVQVKLPDDVVASAER